MPPAPPTLNIFLKGYFVSFCYSFVITDILSNCPGLYGYNLSGCDMVDTTAQSDELQRIEALHRNGILGAPSEDIFDSITATAAAVCEAPIGVISLIESDRLWFLSRSGIDLRETSRSNAFCDYAIANVGLTEIPDASTDARFNLSLIHI